MHLPNLPGTESSVQKVHKWPRSAISRICPSMTLTQTKPTRHGINVENEHKCSSSAMSRICPSTILTHTKLTRHGIKCRERTQVFRLHKPPSTPGTSLSRLMGDCKSTNLGRDRLRSVDRNNKTTLLLTRRCGTNKSYAKDLSPRMVKLQDVS